MAASLQPTGIIDIGSNSVRFVVFGGAERVPSTLFNEKISPGLGRGVEKDGKLSPDAMKRALAALTRFARLADDMSLSRMHVVATAAVRDASNGGDFLEEVRKIGLDPTVLSGEEEAELAANGVLSAIPEADGIVADLGGGSLELTEVRDGSIGERLSLPIGVFRIGDSRATDLAKRIRKAIDAHKISGRGNLYLVGGSFRALARLDLADLDHPLPIVHQHRIAPARLPILRSLVKRGDAAVLRRITRLSADRVEILPAAMILFSVLLDVFRPDQAVVSAFGLREGLIFRGSAPEVQAQDPLLAAAFEIGDALGRFGDHGAAIDRWIDPIFPDDGDGERRIRLAACLMSDVAWNAHPDYRAERAVDMALHGNFVGIDAHGRAFLGQVLSHAFASEYPLPAGVAGLLTGDEIEKAETWGRAIRLAQRLSGGAEAGLERSSLTLEEKELVLTVSGSADWIGETATKRLGQIAKAIGRKAAIRTA